MIFLLPSSAAERIEGYGSNWGRIDVKVDTVDGVVLLVGASNAEKLSLPVHSGWLDQHYLSPSSVRVGVGVWYRSDAGLANDGYQRAIRSGALDTASEFRPRLGSWNFPPADGAWWVLTIARPHGGEPEWAAWQVSRYTAEWFPLTVVGEDQPLLQPLESAWPLSVLASRHVLLVGAGSIGGAAAVALAGYGVRKLTIIDPEHLEPRNFARHQLKRTLAGRRKATAMRDELLDRDSDLDVAAHVLDVTRDADEIRPLLREADTVLCATDGVASRRAINHLATWARTESVFACVLENGAYGEIVRVRPGQSGCLQCDRDVLYETGAFDPEPQLDRDYTLGGGARPMSAVGGDLALVGQLAAKVVVASLLERSGERAQALPGDVLTIALRPVPDLRAPFDSERCLDARWRDLPRPRAQCPTCGTS